MAFNYHIRHDAYYRGFILEWLRNIMRIKISNGEKVGDCPEDKLKFFSFIDQLQNTRALNPVTPERRNKEWVMDAWDNPAQLKEQSPQKSKFINKMIENYQSKTFRLKKVQFLSEKVQTSEKQSTPLKKREGNSTQIGEKQNKTKQEIERKPRPRLYSISKPTRRNVAVGEQETGPFKVAVGSFVYPLIKEKEGQKRYGTEKGHRRIQRFHSFVARTIRR